MKKTRAQSITETLTIFRHRPYITQVKVQDDTPPGTALQSVRGYTANYDNPAYAYSGWWWQETGKIDKDNLPVGVTAIEPDPSDQPYTPEWNKEPTGVIPSELTLSGSRGFVHMSAMRNDDSPENVKGSNPTGHARPTIRLAERLLQKNTYLDDYFREQLRDNVPNELSLKGTQGYSYQNTKGYKGGGRYFLNGMRLQDYKNE